MDVLTSAFAWLNDPLNWVGKNGVLALTRDHIVVSVLAVLLAAVVALPVGLWLGHRGRGGTVGVVVANTTRALPTLALLTLLAATGLFGNTATVLACAVFAVPPLLTNTVTGLGEVDADVRDAARGVGMSGRRSLWAVELPLAVPLIAAGVRTASVQVLATVPLAALVGGRSLGTIVVTGFGTQDYGQVLAGGILVAGLCLVAEGLLAIAQYVLTPRGLRALARDSSDGPTRRTRRSHITSPGVAVPAASRSNRSGPSS
ncbi:ABC transporter permease [Cellulomonas sp. ICMP 17802]|uniref:ABC transporter permease n=1 Tax=Cellulomonas sp. ICMP 17802 TaxID=3239199 RepID=UPI00351B2336